MPRAPRTRTAFEAQQTGARRRRQLVVAVTAVVVVGAMVIAVVVRVTRPTAGPAPAAYKQRIDAAVMSLANDLIRVGQADQAWAAGTTNTATMVGTLNGALPDAEAAPEAIQRLQVPRHDEAAGVRYAAAARLDVDYLRVELAATAQPPGQLRDELRRSARRIRTLADRIFDQGTAVVATATPPTSDADVQTIEAPEVPDWVAEGLAPGPPLRPSPPPPPPSTAPLRQAARPRQSAPAWVLAVRSIGIPSFALAANGTAEAFGAQADRLTADAATLWALPDPGGARDRSATASLAVLTAAEAARVAEGAMVAGAQGLRAVAADLATIATGLWEPILSTDGP